MKRVRLVLLGMMMGLIPGMVAATGNLMVKVEPAGKDRMLVHITNVKSSQYEIELVNTRGDVVYYKMTDSPSSVYSKYYDFSMLKDGEYSLTVNINKEKKVSTLKINKGKVEVLNQRKEVEPYFTIKDNKLELTYLNFEQENLHLMVYDNNELLYHKKLKPEFTIIQGLDLSKLKSGIYSAVLATKYSHFEYPIVIK